MNRHDLALAEAIRDLETQAAAHDSLRSTGATVLAAASIGSGFLAPAALDGTKGFPGLAWVAAIGVLTTVAAVLYLVRPTAMTTSAKASTILGPSWNDLPANTLVETFVSMAEGWSDKNERQLTRASRALYVATVGTLAAFVGWTLLLATR